jgi:hypothetical protein
MYTTDFDKLLRLYEIALDSQNPADAQRVFNLVRPIAERMIYELLEVSLVARNLVDGKRDVTTEDLISAVHHARNVVV